MKVCFVGLGSIGSRHLRNSIIVMKENNIAYHIDLLRSGINNSEKDDIWNEIQDVYYHPEKLPTDYDIIFITNPTSKHYETLVALQHKSKHFFIEKPVFSKTDTLTQEFAIASDKNRVCYVACPLRYTRVIQYIKDYVAHLNVYCVRAICSSYLPDWRKGVDYRTTYSAKKELGGGVDIDLIHEWDYLCYLFGMPINVYNMKGKFSNLEITSNDLSIYIAEYKNKLVELHLDYFGKENKRILELYTESGTVIVDINKSTIKREGQMIKLAQERNDFYLEEMRSFFEMVNGTRECENDVLHAVSVLKIAKGEFVS